MVVAPSACILRTYKSPEVQTAHLHGSIESEYEVLCLHPLWIKNLVIWLFKCYSSLCVLDPSPTLLFTLNFGCTNDCSCCVNFDLLSFLSLKLWLHKCCETKAWFKKWLLIFVAGVLRDSCNVHERNLFWYLVHTVFCSLTWYMNIPDCLVV